MNNKISYLRWFDILVVTIILFGFAIVNSLYGYYQLINGHKSLDQAITFTTSDNIEAIITQSIFLFVSYLYLKWRKFDFKAWTVSPSIKGLGLAVIIFCITAVTLDICSYITDQFNGVHYTVDYRIESAKSLVGRADIFTVIHAIINGFYEELFFLGVCLAVKPQYLKWALLYSFIVRASFHTYQGLDAALLVGFVYGILIYFLYKKSNSNNLFAFGIGHGIADIIGLGLLSYVLMFLKYTSIL